MRPPSTAPAHRLAAALAASIVLHGTAAYVVAAPLSGAAQARGTAGGQPVRARLVGADSEASAQAARPAAAAAAAPAAPPTLAQASAPRGLPAPARYYLPSQLDARPRLLTRVEPRYPQGAPPEGGHAVVRLLIGADGKVEQAIVVESTPGDRFGAAAAAAFAAAQFSAGMLKGTAVNSQVLIEMDFASLLPPGVAGLPPKSRE
ncbi:MAG: TonB family protein [Burkholderiales bacterium]|nr:TonB family protein [Burkholderiales bacterium]